MRNRLAKITLAVLSMLAIAASLSQAQTYAIDTIALNGPTDKRLNFVFVSDGFQSSEMAAYRVGVQSIADQLFATTPYKEYRNYINIFAIEVPSIESGANHPVTAPDCPVGSVVTVVNNFFGSSFDVNSIHRLLVPGNEAAVVQVLFNNFPAYTQAFVLVNSPIYGGSGGNLATASMEASSGEVAIHEIGHSLAKLGDEYGGGTPYPGSERPNTTAETQRGLIRWNKWILPSTPLPTPTTYTGVIGLFEGAAYNDVGWYRPSADCKMRSLGVPFCSVCAETITDTILSNVSPLDTFTPSGSVSLTFHPRDTMTFHLNLVKPVPNTLRISWLLNGHAISANNDSLIVAAAQLSHGANLLEAVIQDTTDLVRLAGGTIRSASAQWHLTLLSNGVANGLNDAAFSFTAGLDRDGNDIHASITLGKASVVTIVLCDIAGREIRTFYRGKINAGTSGLTIPTQGLASGTYSVRCTAGETSKGNLVILAH